MTARILLINPNTTAAITDKVVAAARALAPDLTFAGVTGRFGARYVASRAAYAIAGHAALDAWADAGDGHDAVILACFGDPGLDALRELSSKPVVGMADAALHAALQLVRRVSIVTGGARWQSMLQDFVAAQGLRDRVASIRTVAPTGGAIAENPAAAVAVLAEACQRCVADDGAEAVILGGAGLVGLRERVQAQVKAPVIDGLAAAIAAVRGMIAITPPLPTPAPFAPLDPVDCVGLSDALAKHIQGI
jgi:Asp/Glu/hydantoin racemase